jgi:hypothetical protein
MTRASTVRLRKVAGGYAVQLGLNPANVACTPGKAKGEYLVCTWATEEAARAEARQWGFREEGDG